MKSAAQRKRDERRRKREGIILVEVEVKPHSRDVFAEARWLREWDENDPQAVQAAVQRLINEMRVDDEGD